MFDVASYLPNWVIAGVPDWLLPYLSYLLIWGAITVPGVLIGWMLVFPKAGQSWWAGFIPGYNIYVLVVGVARLSILWFILVLDPRRADHRGHPGQRRGRPPVRADGGIRPWAGAARVCVLPHSGVGPVRISRLKSAFAARASVSCSPTCNGLVS